jgi:uncharacterized phage protein (TIGR01671 family)
LSDPIAPKFRIWNNKSARIWPVDKIVWGDNGKCHPVSGESFLVYSDDDVLMQWTGLLDVDGTEIFVGDIVRFISFNAIEKVIYDPPRFKTASCSLQGYECKIIGNIFENPDLLEAQIV